MKDTIDDRYDQSCGSGANCNQYGLDDGFIRALLANVVSLIVTLAGPSIECWLLSNMHLVMRVVDKVAMRSTVPLRLRNVTDANVSVPSRFGTLMIVGPVMPAVLLP